MKILHTSDWHLGRTLHGRKRHAEFEAFLDWLTATIRDRGIDVLLVAGDVFDTGTPGPRAQELYYRFLAGLTGTPCRHVVIIAGNHDSPAFLNAPRALLRALDVHVVGGGTREDVSNALGEQVIVLRDPQGLPELIVCAVPYLRDRDIRTSEPGESIEDKERKLVEGIRNHYAAVGALAERVREQVQEQERDQGRESGGGIPIVGMGHLFTAGAQTVDGDGVRDLYVGSLAHVTAGIFPACFDYVALGHLHVPQTVAGRETIRYSGSPVAMGFGEARQRKSLCEVTLEVVNDVTAVGVNLIDIPVFQRMERIKGDWTHIEERLRYLAADADPHDTDVPDRNGGTDGTVWIEVVYNGDDIIGDLRERLDAAVAGTGLSILCVRNARVITRVLEQAHHEETLDDLDEYDVFDRCLDAHEVAPAQREQLRHAYRETILALQEEGHHEQGVEPGSERGSRKRSDA